MNCSTIVGSSTKIKDGANFQMYAVINRLKMVVDHPITVEKLEKYNVLMVVDHRIIVN